MLVVGTSLNPDKNRRKISDEILPEQIRQQSAGSSGSGFIVWEPCISEPLTTNMAKYASQM